MSVGLALALGLGIGLLVGVPLLLAVILAVNDSMADHYLHARTHCGCGPWRAMYRAYYAELTGRWPW